MSDNTKTASNAKQQFKKKSQAGIIWRRFKRNRLAIIGMCVFIVMASLVVFADLYLDYDIDALEMHMKERYQAPSAEHWFGTDDYGRDYFARVIYGGRISMSVGVLTVCVSLFFGSIIGATSAYYGGRVDNILMRFMDILMAIPANLLAITLISALGSSFFNLILSMGLSQIPRMSRIVRSSVLSVKSMDYVEASRSYGTRDARIIFRHIIPNAMGPILVQVTQTVARSVLTISSLSFIGLGITEPTPEWGSMLSTAKANMRYYPYLALFPGVAIILSVMSLTLVGDALRDAMDPRLRN